MTREEVCHDILCTGGRAEDDYLLFTYSRCTRGQGMMG
jgi:hypothetical protein